MKRYTWMPIGILALAAIASPCRAQDTSPWHFPIRGSDLIYLVNYSPFHSRPRVTLGTPCAPCPTPYMLPGIGDPKLPDPKSVDPKSVDPKSPDAASPTTPTSPEQ